MEGPSTPKIGRVIPSRKPRIILAACGCVAAMKFGHLYRSFSEWADVRAVATHSSLSFIDRASLPSNFIMYTDRDEWANWSKIGDSILHISLTKWADFMVIAPLSAHTLAKLSGGLCDNLLTCIVRAWDYRKTIFAAPAMNSSMWSNPLTEKHFSALDDMGISFILPVVENLPGGQSVSGAMQEVSVIDKTVRLFVVSQFNKHVKSMNAT